MINNSRLIIEIPTALKKELKIRLKDFHKYPVSVTGFVRNILLALLSLDLENFDVLLDNPENYIVEALRQFLPAKHTNQNVTVLR